MSDKTEELKRPIKADYVSSVPSYNYTTKIEEFDAALKDYTINLAKYYAALEDYATKLEESNRQLEWMLRQNLNS